MGLGRVITRAIIGGVLTHSTLPRVPTAGRNRTWPRYAGFRASASSTSERSYDCERSREDNELANNANYHGQFLLDHVTEINEQHLKNYAVAVRKVAIGAMKLCQKYGIYSDIQTVTYDSRRKMIMLNGNDHYSLM